MYIHGVPKSVARALRAFAASQNEQTARDLVVIVRDRADEMVMSAPLRALLKGLRTDLVGVSYIARAKQIFAPYASTLGLQVAS